MIPKSVTVINAGAFKNCQKLEKVTFVEGSELREIGYYAFDNCIKLKNIVLPKSVTHIGNYCFSNSGLTEIVIP